MNESTEFRKFAKIPRLSRDMVITEKLDGTNAQIYIVDEKEAIPGAIAVAAMHNSLMYVGSRNRYLSTTDDNFGFAAWAQANGAELFELGEGRHYGEWWGRGIQRGYGLTEKRFSLFNVGKWYDPRNREEFRSMFYGKHTEPVVNEAANPCPPCCTVVPILFSGKFDTEFAGHILSRLGDEGSIAAPGFMKPEGIVIYHTQSGYLFKKTLEDDEKGKGE